MAREQVIWEHVLDKGRLQVEGFSAGFRLTGASKKKPTR